MKRLIAPILGAMLIIVIGTVMTGGECRTLECRHLPEREALPSPSHPLGGFWKFDDCEDDFGVAIGPSGDRYAVTFCGPGGCFDPGSYRPDTAIEGDPGYRVLDDDTIQINTQDGFETLVRCPGR